MNKLMKSILTICMIACFVTVVFNTAAIAGDQLIDTKIEKILVKVDKNGADYVIIIIKENRVLNGINYKADVVVTAFGTQVEGASKLTEGDNLKAICQETSYQGSKNYKLVQLL